MPDIQTLLLVALVISALLSAALAFVAVGPQRELRIWGWGLALQAIGYVLLLERPSLPASLSIVGANVAFGATLAFYAEALSRFQGRQPNRLLFWAPPILFLLAFPWLVDQYETRVLLASCIFLFQALLLGKLVVVGLGATPGRGQYMLLVAIAIWSAVQVGRLVAQLSGAGASHALLERSPAQAMQFLGSLSASLLLAFGVLVMMRERAEALLQSSERHHRRLIENAAEGVAVIEQQVFRYVNPHLCHLAGRPATELIGRRYAEVLHPEDRVLSQEVHGQRLMGLAENRSYEARLQRPDGSERWVRISGVRFDWEGRAAVLVFLTDVTATHDEDSRIRDLAFRDSLTGLANRARLIEQTEQALADPSAQPRHGALVVLDLDNFKPLNDRHGHAAGDLLLREAADRLRAAVRRDDMVARLGGDEFVVLVRGLHGDRPTATRQARELAEKLRAALAEPYRLDAGAGGRIEHACTASVGVVLFEPGETSSLALLERADRAMYEAKQSGRNTVAMDTGASGVPGAAGQAATST